MSALTEVIKHLSEDERIKLFDGVFDFNNPDSLDLYDAEDDLLDIGITALIDNTFQILATRIAAQRVHGRLTNVYKVEVSYFELMGDSIIVPGDSLWDSLLNAKIQIKSNPSKLSIVYVQP